MPDPETIAAGEHLLLLRRDRWEYAARRAATGVVAILAETEDLEVVLTEQFRVPLQARVIDLPAGLVGDGADRAEAVVTAAQRELAEETGYASAHWTTLASWPTSPGLTDESVTVLHAGGAVRRSAGGGVDGEDIIVHRIPLAQLRPWLAAAHARGLLVDPKIYASLWLREGMLIPP